MKRIVITGATSSIGIALVNKFLDEDAEILVLCHSGSKRKRLIPPSDRIIQIECDLDDFKDLEIYNEKAYDVFYHLAWSATIGNNAKNNIGAHINNIQYTIDAVDLAKRLGCKKFIGTGSQAEYGRVDKALNELTPTFPENAYGIAKLCAGQMSRLRCEQIGLEHIWTRILSAYGPYDNEKTMIIALIKNMLQKRKSQCTAGEQIWDYIYYKDVAQALYLLGKKGVNGKVYCIGSGEGRSLKQYIIQMRDCIAPEAEIGFGEVPYGNKQVMHLCADISNLKKDTGFEIQYSFEEGIKETVALYKEISDKDIE